MIYMLAKFVDIIIKKIDMENYFSIFTYCKF